MNSRQAISNFAWVILAYLAWVIQLYLKEGFSSPAQASFLLNYADNSTSAGYFLHIMPMPVHNFK